MHRSENTGRLFLKLVNIPIPVSDNHAGSHGSHFKQVLRHQMGDADAPVGGRAAGQVPLMNAYSPVHPHEIGHLGRFKPFSGPCGILPYIPVPQLPGGIDERAVIGMVVRILGGDAEIAGGRHAGTPSGTDGRIRDAVRPAVHVHHLLLLVHHDQELSGQGRIVLPFEQVSRNGSAFLKIPGHFLHRNIGRGRRGRAPTRGAAGGKQERNAQAGNQQMEKG